VVPKSETASKPLIIRHLQIETAEVGSNIEEVMARGGRVVMISDAAGVARQHDRLAFGIAIPHCAPFVALLLYAIPIQLLAYHTAVIKGTDVDQPRNLAKSVTVEEWPTSSNGRLKCRGRRLAIRCCELTCGGPPAHAAYERAGGELMRGTRDWPAWE
jgi:hypothetical protein